MTAKSIYPKSVREEALSLAVSAMRQEAQGKACDPHHLNNAEMSLMNVFYDPADRETALSRIANACFGGIKNPNIAQAYRYGATSGIGRLDAAVPVKGDKRKVLKP